MAASLMLLGAGAASATPLSWSLSFNDAIFKTPTVTKPDGVEFARHGDAGLNGSERPYARVVRAGAVIATEDNPYLNDNRGELALTDLTPGDILQVLDATTGTVNTQATFDGGATFDPNTCAGSAAASGRKSNPSVVTSIGAYTVVPYVGTDGEDYTEAVNGATTGATDTTFTGSFAQPLVVGQYLWALEEQLPSQALAIDTYAERVVGPCPIKDVTPPVAARKLVGKLKSLRLTDLYGKARGITFTVTSDEAATLDAALSLTTVKGSGKRASGKSVAIGGLHRSIPAASPTRIRVLAHSASRRALRRAAGEQGSTLILTAKVTDAAGNVTALPLTRLSVPRR